MDAPFNAAPLLTSGLLNMKWVEFRENIRETDERDGWAVAVCGPRRENQAVQISDTDVRDY